MQIGQYEIRRQIAQGGMGVVYQAVDPSGKLVALKLIQVDDMSGADLEAFRRRFYSECDALKKMDHPHVVRYLDEGEHEGRPFLVQQFIAGVRLTDWLRQPASIPADVAVQLGLELLDALVHVHGCGVHHRDVNPNNVLLVGADDPTGPHVRLIDFGFARINDGRTHTWVARGGTKYYAAPEQAIFHIETEEYDRYWTTPASDVYGAAAVLFRLLMGRPPYSDDAAAQLDFVLAQAMIWNGRLPLWQPADQGISLSPELKHLLTVSLAPRPEQRPATVSALRDALLTCPEARAAQVRVLAGEVSAGRWTRAIRMHQLLQRQYPTWPYLHARFIEAMLDGPPLAGAPPEGVTAAFSSLCALADAPGSSSLVLRAVVSIGRTWGEAVAQSQTLREQFRARPGSRALGLAFLRTFQPEAALAFLDPSTDGTLRGVAFLVLGQFAAAAAAVRVADVVPEPDGDGFIINEAPLDDLGHAVYAIASTMAALTEAAWSAHFDRPCVDAIPGLSAVYALAHALHLADAGCLDEAFAVLNGALHALRDVKPPARVLREDLLAAWLPPPRVWMHRFRRRVLDAPKGPPRAARAQWLRGLNQRPPESGTARTDEVLLEVDIALALLLANPARAGSRDLEVIRAMTERPEAPRETQLRLARALLHVGQPKDALALAQNVLPSTDPYEEGLWIEIVGRAMLAVRREQASQA
jgi:hypothetical protein